MLKLLQSMGVRILQYTLGSVFNSASGALAMIGSPY